MRRWSEAGGLHYWTFIHVEETLGVGGTFCLHIPISFLIAQARPRSMFITSSSKTAFLPECSYYTWTSQVTWPCSFATSIIISFTSVLLLSHVRLFATVWTAAHQASLSITNSQSLLKLMSIESVMPSNHILCRPLLLLPSVFPNIRVFSDESVLHIRWPKYWSFSFSINPSNEYSGLISFRMDWLDLPEVQGTLKSLFQYHSSKASILKHSAFFLFFFFRM